jgi:hypothetical protein
MPKKGAQEHAIDPAVLKVHQSLEATLGHFMATVGEMCRNWDSKLQAAMPLNPKAKFFLEEPETADTPNSTHKKSSPLLKRRSFAAAATATAEASGAAAAPSSPGGASTKSDDVIPDHTELLKQLRVLKGEARTLMKVLDQIHDWIALNVPAIGGDEEDSGVEVLGVVLQNVEDTTEALGEVYGMESKYLSDRAELEATYAHRPDCPSVQRTFKVLNSDAWDELERGWRAMIRGSLLLHSTLAKNMKILREPRVTRGAPLT